MWEDNDIADGISSEKEANVHSSDQIKNNKFAKRDEKTWFKKQRCWGSS